MQVESVRDHAAHKSDDAAVWLEEVDDALSSRTCCAARAARGRTGRLQISAERLNVFAIGAEGEALPPMDAAVGRYAPSVAKYRV